MFRPQYAALCWRRQGKEVQVLLITSRDTGRWVIPKGWPIKGLGPAEAAAREAWEEAGVRGRAVPDCLGVYSYDKRRDDKPPVPCLVAVYALEVDALDTTFPEAGQRRLKWFAPAKAARKVDEPELRALLEGFTPGGGVSGTTGKAAGKGADNAPGDPGQRKGA